MPELFNVHGFALPPRFTGDSRWPGVDHKVSGRMPTTKRHLKTRFRCGFGSKILSLAVDIHSPVHYAKGTQSAIPLRA